MLDFFIVSILAFSSFAQTAPQPNPEDMKRYWQVLIPSIPSLVKQAFPDDRSTGPNQTPIIETADITGDGIPEALVYLGGQGGAYTDYVTVMRIEQGKAVVALFKEPNGRVSPQIFLQGASVRHGEHARMLPDKQAIYQARYSDRSLECLAARVIVIESSRISN